MKELATNEATDTPMLFPFEPQQFWTSLRQVVREEVRQAEKIKQKAPTFETPGMTYKPLYNIAEVCALFRITKPTNYDWVKYGKLKPYKIRFPVYFLHQDIQKLLHPDI